MKEDPETLESLAARMDALERRVDILEHGAALQGDFAIPLAASSQPSVSIADQDQPQSTSGVPGFFFVAGISLLGIAGAYLLRAVAESAVVPRWMVGIAAAVYASGWLVASARSENKLRLASGFYASTSILILGPMLWEMTLRFHAFSALAALSILAAFSIAVAGTAWGRERSVVFFLAFGGIALTALALSVATHQMGGFTALLLAMLIVAQFRSIRDFPARVGPVVALAADVAVWSLVVIYRMPENARTDYPALNHWTVVAFAVLLFVIGAATLGIRMGVQRQRISIFEITQNMAALAIMLACVMMLWPQSYSIVLGIVCLALAALCYAEGFGPLRISGAPRNYRVFAVWSGALLLAGLYVAVPVDSASVLLALAGLAAIEVAIRIRCEILELHGVLFLMIAAVTSGTMSYAFHALGGSLPGSLPWNIAAVAVCALVSYIASDEKPGEVWDKQVLHFIPALLAACALLGFLTKGLVALVALALVPGTFHVAFIRTLAVCAIALVLAFGGSHWRRIEMTRVAYLATAFVVTKLLFEDLRHGHLGFTAASIALVALTLIAVPRLGRQLRNV